MGKLRMGVCVRDIGGQKDIFSEREREKDIKIVRGRE